MLEHIFWNLFIASGNPETYMQYRAYQEVWQKEWMYGKNDQDQGNHRGGDTHRRAGQAAGDSSEVKEDYP